MTEEKETKLDIPSGMSNPWIFVQKRIIFENKIAMTEAFVNYHKIYARDKENDGLLQNCIVSIRQLYLEIKGMVKKNKIAKKNCQNSIDYMDRMIDDLGKTFTSDDFPELYKHYVGLLEMLVYIGLTDIEFKGENPHEAVMDQGA